MLVLLVIGEILVILLILAVLMMLAVIGLMWKILSLAWSGLDDLCYDIGPKVFDRFSKLLASRGR